MGHDKDNTNRDKSEWYSYTSLSPSTMPGGTEDMWDNSLDTAASSDHRSSVETSCMGTMPLVFGELPIGAPPMAHDSLPRKFPYWALACCHLTNMRPQQQTVLQSNHN
jgi:hypothetical protein